MPSACRPWATLCTLALLSMGVMPGTVAMPATGETAAAPSQHPQLDITTSIKMGGPIFGGKIGPFTSGQELTITCSTKSPAPVSLSWAEGGQTLEAVGGNASTRFSLATLRPADSGRRFTCQDAVTGGHETVELDVVKQTFDLEIWTTGGVQLKDEDTLTLSAGEDLNLTCVAQGYGATKGSWWEGDEELPAIKSVYSYASSTRLLLPGAGFTSVGRRFTCRVLGAVDMSIVVVGWTQGRKTVASPSPSPGKAPKTSTTMSPYTSDKKFETSKDIPGGDTTLSTVSPEKTTSPTGENKSVATSTPAGQGTPVSEAVTTSVEPPTKSEMNMYLIIGGAAITLIGFVVVVLIFVILKLCRKIDKIENPISRQQGNSSEQRARAGTTGQSTLENLLPGPPRVGEGDGMTTSGGRMSLMLDDRDHSYYYPDLINNSYYYPKPTHCRNEIQ